MPEEPKTPNSLTVTRLLRKMTKYMLHYLRGRFGNQKVVLDLMKNWLTKEGVEYIYTRFMTDIELEQHKSDAYEVLEFSYSSREVLYKKVSEYIGKDVPIDFLEFGVFKGESILKWLEINKNEKSRFYGFDSFEGLPEAWYQDRLKGHFDVNGQVPSSNDSRLTFVKGWFNNTLPEFISNFNKKNELIVHMDADLLTSTIYVLFMLNEAISKGTIIIFDEFRGQEAAAFNIYTRSCERKYRVLFARRDMLKIAVEIV